MPDLKNYNEPSDDFSKLIQQKLEDYRMPVDEACWDEIEQRLQPKGNRRFMWWIGGAAASIVVIISALLFNSQGNDVSPLKMITAGEIVMPPKHERKTEESTQNIETITPAAPVYQSMVPLISRQTARNNIALNSGDQQDTNTIIDQIITAIDTVNLADNITGNATDNTPVGNTLPDKQLPDNEQTSDKQASTPSESKKSNAAQSRKTERLLLPEKERSDNNWLLAASVSSSNGISTEGSNNLMFSNMSADASSPDGASLLFANNMLESEEFSEIDHAVPLSFGITVRKDINERIGVETGLVYTYLSTTMKKTGTPYYQAKQEIHYLGVPLNLVVYLWNNPKWNVYISGGGMAEKGLKGIYSQDMFVNKEKTSNIRDKGSVNGMQWSLNASVGASYNFYNGWGLYVEPRLSYYFDNNQPMSIRTDKNTVFGLGAGLRFQF
ncbi:MULTISPECIES: porin family protein [unclassified Dysgonomonas]|uniref:porin family protein n=1 Tax=unclassified Dysgonomonas TaxID=2630389 RepID=UPI0024744AB0|nr:MULTISPECIES: porin family protein [unclassified Dysgonomonas]